MNNKIEQLILTVMSRQLERYSIKNHLSLYSSKDFQLLPIVDKIVIHTDVINRKYLKKNWKKPKKINNYGARKISIYHHRTKTFCDLPIEFVIEEEKIHKIMDKSKKPITIKINPSRFKDFKDFILTLNRILNYQNANYTIAQIDCALVLPKEIFNLDLLVRSIYIENKQLTREFCSDIMLDCYDILSLSDDEKDSYSSSDYLSFIDPHYKQQRGQISGYYNGSSPDLLVIYDAEIYIKKDSSKKKILKRYTCLHVDNPSSYHKQFLTKYENKILIVEKRLSGPELLGFTSIDDLFDIYTLKPFNDLQFFDWNIDKDKLQSLRNRNHVFAIMTECMIRGFQQTKKLFDHGHFKDKYMGTIFKELRAFKDDLRLTDLFNENFNSGMQKIIGEKIILPAGPNKKVKKQSSMRNFMSKLF